MNHIPLFILGSALLALAFAAEITAVSYSGLSYAPLTSYRYPHQGWKASFDFDIEESVSKGDHFDLSMDHVYRVKFDNDDSTMIAQLQDGSQAFQCYVRQQAAYLHDATQMRCEALKGLTSSVSGSISFSLSFSSGGSAYSPELKNADTFHAGTNEVSLGEKMSASIDFDKSNFEKDIYTIGRTTTYSNFETYYLAMKCPNGYLLGGVQTIAYDKLGKNLNLDCSSTQIYLSDSFNDWSLPLNYKEADAAVSCHDNLLKVSLNRTEENQLLWVNALQSIAEGINTVQHDVQVEYSCSDTMKNTVYSTDFHTIVEYTVYQGSAFATVSDSSSVATSTVTSCPKCTMTSLSSIESSCSKCSNSGPSTSPTISSTMSSPPASSSLSCSTCETSTPSKSITVSTIHCSECHNSTVTSSSTSLKSTSSTLFSSMSSTATSSSRSTTSNSTSSGFTESSTSPSGSQSSTVTISSLSSASTPSSSTPSASTPSSSTPSASTPSSSTPSSSTPSASTPSSSTPSSSTPSSSTPSSSTPSSSTPTLSSTDSSTTSSTWSSTDSISSASSTSASSAPPSSSAESTTTGSTPTSSSLVSSQTSSTSTLMSLNSTSLTPSTTLTRSTQSSNSVLSNTSSPVTSASTLPSEPTSPSSSSILPSGSSPPPVTTWSTLCDTCTSSTNEHLTSSSILTSTEGASETKTIVTEWSSTLNLNSSVTNSCSTCKSSSIPGISTTTQSVACTHCSEGAAISSFPDSQVDSKSTQTTSSEYARSVDSREGQPSTIGSSSSSPESVLSGSFTSNIFSTTQATSVKSGSTSITQASSTSFSSSAGMTLQPLSLQPIPLTSESLSLAYEGQAAVLRGDGAYALIGALCLLVL